MTFGAWLREQRLALNLSRAALGDAAGVHRNTIHRWESGSGVPNAYQYTRMRQFISRRTGKRL